MADKIIRKKFMALILTLTMVLRLMPAIAITASPVTPPDENYDEVEIEKPIVTFPHGSLQIKSQG